MKAKSCPTDAPLNEAVIQYASQCVKCALCLEHCPTYQLSQDENESPRGRIALFQAIAEEKLPLTPKVEQHLARCLGCRACEKVCPAKVEYGVLLTKGRALVRKIAPRLTQKPISVALLQILARHPSLQRKIQWLIWLSQKLYLRQIARKLNLLSLLQLNRLDALMPEVAKPQKINAFYPTSHPTKGKVQLFLGCFNSWSETNTLRASLFVLEKLGFEVVIPPSQTCCGALALHAGFDENAKILAAQNSHAFSLENAPILTLATGCQSVLQNDDQHFSSHSVFSRQVIDIMQFIERISAIDEHFAEIPGSVVVHTPCTSRNTNPNPPAVATLLTKIPGLKVSTFSSPFCCGSAGTYMLEHPHYSQALRDKLLSELVNKKTDFLATSNIGCALHFKQALQNLNSGIKVIHPIVLIANSLGFKSFRF